MNTNSITKFFTLVSIFVVTGFMAANTASAATTFKTREECVAQKTSDREEKCDAETDATKKDSCLNTAARQASKDPICLALPTESKASEGDNDCEEAFREYKKNLGDAQSACESVVGKSGDTKKSCSDKIKECEGMASSTSSQTEQQDNGISSTLNIFRAVIGGEESLGLSGSSCLVDIDSKEARDAEKEFRDRRKELTDEKKKIEDEAVKDKEDNDKEITRITKEIQELQRENKKLLAEVDTKMREKGYDTQKELIAAGARLKDLTKQSSKVNDKIRALNFSFADRMLDTSQQKQNLRCKGALDTAKGCMIKSAKGIRDPNDKTCEGFPFAIKSKGPKATAELKAQLQVVADACYEKEERDKKKMQFDQQEQLTTLQRELTSIQEQMEQEGKSQQASSENSQKIQQEAEREKQEAQANLAEQTSTLQGEMAQFAQKLQLKSQKSTERLQKLAQDLQTLELEEKTGKRSKTKLASRAVRATNVDLAEVKAMCECKDDLSGSTAPSKKREAICKKTKDTIPSGGEERKKRSTGKSGSTF